MFIKVLSVANKLFLLFTCFTENMLTTSYNKQVSQENQNNENVTSLYFSPTIGCTMYTIFFSLAIFFSLVS